MSAKPHSCSTMETILGSLPCLICFEMIEKHISVPSDAPEKLFRNCNKYLHSTLTKETLKDIKLHNENQVPLCKSCFDSALELTQLSQQLKTIQKDISDLTVAFSMAIFHRRSQVYSIGQSSKTSSIVEFNKACLPPNLFKKKIGDQNILDNKNEEMDINGLNLQTDISNVKYESSDIQFDNLSENPQSSITNDNAEIQFNKENLDKQSGESTIEQHQNLASVSEMKIVQITDRNVSKKDTDSKNANGIKLADLLKSVKMPKIILERIKIVGHKLDVSVANSLQTNCESRQQNVRETRKNDEFSVHSFDPKSPEDGKLLKCFYCEKTFAQECYRTLHHKTHKLHQKIYKRPLVKQKFVYGSSQKICQVTPTGEKTFYKCSYCEKEFPKPSSLQIHERNHTGEKPFKCSFCNKRFNESGHLKNHERTHSGEKPYKCSFCNFRCIQSGHLKTHERNHTGEKPFKCSFCNCGFKSSSNLNRHEIIHTGENPFKCTFCGWCFSRKSKLIVHARQHTREELNNRSLYCEKTLSGISDKNSQQISPAEQLSSLVSQLANQKEAGGSLGHTKKSCYKCSYCEKEFPKPSSLLIHERIHTGEKPYKCSFCNAQFRECSGMKKHERTHTGERPFKCSLCNNRFNQRNNLKRHERTHTGEKPFKCIFCGERFSQNRSLKIHEKLHTTKKTYKCLYCEKTFSGINDKNSHQKCHPEHISSLFSQFGNENDESLGHLKHKAQMNYTGHMEFKCSFCELTFSHDEERDNHEKIHRREEFIIGI